MTNKILELTQKIYDEGVVKAKTEANQIIADAKKEADEIIKLAQKQELEIKEQTKKQLEKFKENTNSELQLAARQFISKLKQKITELVLAEQVEVPIQDTFEDREFIKNLISTLIKNWNPQNPEDLNLTVLLPSKDEKEFYQFFESKANNALNNGVDIQFNEKLTNGFKIGPKDGSYIISFTDTDFEEYFKSYLKEKTKNYLFSSDK